MVNENESPTQDAPPTQTLPAAPAEGGGNPGSSDPRLRRVSVFAAASHAERPGEDAGHSTAQIPAVSDAAAAASADGATSDRGINGGDVTQEPEPRRRRRWPIWTLAGILVLLGLAGAGTAYASRYSDVALPRTTVAGTDVSGMSHSEIVTLVQDKAEAATVTIDGDVSATATLADLGTTVDAEATADAVMAPNADVLDRFRALSSATDVDVVTNSDAETLAQYAISLVPSDMAAATNASVTLDEATATFGITRSSSGTALDNAPLATAAADAASSLEPQSAKVSFLTTDPAVSDADAQSVADTANSWVAQDVTITSADGETSYTADATQKASWITVTATPDAAPTLSVNSDAVKTWVDTEAADAKVEPVNGVRNVNSSGAVVTTVTQAVDGKDVSNAEAITTAITTALGSGTAYTGSFEMTTTTATWTERTIADGAEALAYPAAEGEKWVDISLSNKTVTAYEGATVVYGPTPMVDGAAATPTVTGTYHVYLKYETQTMRGQNADGSDYETEGVPWITYWYQGYALHGAPWRSSFGYSGSHGCVNLPVSTAKWYYDWTEIGTAVVSHY